MGHRVGGKVCIVTGAAKGIGESAARLLAKEGASVVLTDIDDGACNAVSESIAASGARSLALHHDVRDEAAWITVMEQVERTFGRVDVVVNNAGVGIQCAPEDQTLEQWRALLAINLDGVFLGTKHAVRAMKRNQPSGGSIINISSIEGLIADPSLGAYNASKGGVLLYSKSVALYCAQARLGIRVNCVHPGYIWTPLVQGSVNRAPDPVAAKARLEALHPVGHLGEPDDIGWGIVYLASDESKFMTGASLVIDGGYTAQ
jgi:3(or 17)beta-hydroxysteroid dehydrogenase